jgi:hypothetical protein
MAAVGSAVLLVAPFTRKYRDASCWLRSVSFIGSLLIFAGSVFTLVRLSASPARWQYSWMSNIPSYIGAVGTGMLLAVVMSPEFLKRSARSHQASNQALEPTAGRCVVSLFGMKQLSILAKLALASGGSAPSR